MIKKFVDAWYANKDKLEEYIRTTDQSEYDTYEKLLKKLFEIVINPYLEKLGDHDWSTRPYDLDEITMLDHGDYQGTFIFILHRKCYQPSVDDYVYTNTYYGSCSGCDTLQGIHNYSDGLPSDGQVKDYMELLLHLLQRCNKMADTSNLNGRIIDCEEADGLFALLA